MSYSIFIGDLQLPINPETVADSLERKVKEYAVIGQGNVPQLEDTSLKRWNFDFMLLANNDLGIDNFKVPAEVIAYLEDKIKNGTQQRLVISNGTEYGVSVLVYIEKLEKKEVQDGCYEVGLKLVEYVEAKAKETGIPYIQRPGIIPVLKPKKVQGSGYNEKTAADKWSALDHVICGPPGDKKANEIVGDSYIVASDSPIQYTYDPYNYDDSALRDYLSRTDQPIQYTYLPNKQEDNQEDKNRYQINYGLDVFIG